MTEEIEFERDEAGKCRAQRCRAWLYEQGRKDLAARIGTNRAGNPMRPPEGLSVEDATVVAEAFEKAHEGNPDFVPVLAGLDLVTALQLPVAGEAVRHWSPAGGFWSMWPDGQEYV